jgi:hypothetical protein
MKLHCDKCQKPLGDYLYGKGGVEERARITDGTATTLPDIVCYECIPKGAITLEQIKRLLYGTKRTKRLL